MIYIKSAPLSFVRFEHPEDNNYSLDIPFSLPVYGVNHDISFQFLVEQDRPYDQPIQLGTATPEGVGIAAFASPDLLATVESYRYKINGLPNDFFIETVVVGSMSKQYNAVFTKASFYEKLYEDFGIEVVNDYFISESFLDPVIIPAFETNQVAPIATSIDVFWHQGKAIISDRPIGAVNCFSYALLDLPNYHGLPTDVNGNALMAYSNPFRVQSEAAFSSLVTYKCAESAFGFVYDGAIVNKVRLPFYLLAPQFPSKREIYRKSNGVNKVLSAVLEKEYDLTTEQMPEVFHEAMAAMLQHDTIIIENKNIREKVVEVLGVENYSPQWPDEEEGLQFAKAKSKVKVAKFGYTNSNC